MPVISEAARPDLFRRLVSQNLQRQIVLLRDAVSMALETNTRLDASIICALHAAATTFLVLYPGQYRNGDVHVTDSPRKFPPAEQCRELVANLVFELNEHWDHEDAIALAARALWRLTWVHPFEDANGRTARALAQYVLCVKFGRWLPGRLDAMQMLKNRHNEYVEALKEADVSEVSGALDLSKLKMLLLDVLESQISSEIDR